MAMTTQPQLIVFGGPNGAGKTTLARAYAREHQLLYLAADDIAERLSPSDPAAAQLAAGREFLTRLDEVLNRRESVVIESTLAGLTLRRSMRQAHSTGYHTSITFLYLASAAACVARVAQRVRVGGHDVPEVDIRRRFRRSKLNFWTHFRDFADEWFLVYNGRTLLADVSKEVRVAQGTKQISTVIDQQLFRRFVESVVE